MATHGDRAMDALLNDLMEKAELQGYLLTDEIFEAMPESGGLFVAGIPEYRLPREVVRKEIELIRSLGVEIKTGVTVGTDATLDELRSQGFSAFFLGIGAHLGYKLKRQVRYDYALRWRAEDAKRFLGQIWHVERFLTRSFLALERMLWCVVLAGGFLAWLQCRERRLCRQLETEVFVLGQALQASGLSHGEGPPGHCGPGRMSGPAE